MVVVSYSGKEINAKLVYYGAGLSGKTTNLESIYEAVPEGSRGKMVSMKTQSDRTLFFDLLPLDLGEIMGFKTRFLLYTVPGQVFYNATRKLVLKGADAIVFVADSEVGKMDENQESLANLRTNLTDYGLSLDEVPWVIQYNKRDLENRYSVEELNAALNPDGSVPHFEAVANQGRGVFETFRGISHMLMEKVTRDLRRTAVGGAAGRAVLPEPFAGVAHHPTPPPPDMPSKVIPAVAEQPKAPAKPVSRPVDGVVEFEFGRELTLSEREDTPASEVESAPAASTPAEPGLELDSVSAFSNEPELTFEQHTATAVTAPAPLKRGARRISIAAQPAAPPDPVLASADHDFAPVHEAVIPVRLPRKGTREIVIKIVLTDESEI